MEFASKRPGLARGPPAVAAHSRPKPGCRCQRARPTAGADGGAGGPPRRPGWRAAWSTGVPTPCPRRACSPSRWPTRAEPPFETATDLDGRFRFDRLPPGTYRLLVEAAGFPGGREDAGARAVRRRCGPGRRRGRLDRRSGERGGRPVAGARVLLAPDERRDRARDVDAPGRRLRLRRTRRGTLRRARRRRRRGARALARSRPGGPVRRRPSSSSSRRAARIAGRVIDDAGAALADVPVRSRAAAAAPGDDPLPMIVHLGLARAPSPRCRARRLPADRVAAGYVLRRAPPWTRRKGEPVEPCARARARRAHLRPGADPRGGAGGGRARALPGERDRGSDRADRAVAAGRRSGRAAVGRGTRARHDPRDGGRPRGASRSTT